MAVLRGDMLASLPDAMPLNETTETRMSHLARLLTAVTLAFTSHAAFAYPDGPITLVVPFSAGGDADLSARNLGAAAQGVLKQPLVVLNKAGASGAIGSQFVKDAPADGYTLLVGRIGSQAILPALKPDLPYKWDDFTFLGLLELNPVVCVVHADSPYKTLADLARALKEQPGKLNFSSSGSGTVLYLGPQLLFQALGLNKDAAVHITYKGGSDAALAVLSKDVDFTCGNLTSLVAHIKGGKLRALVTTTPERAKDIPDVPTAREAGYPQLEAVVGWSVLYGPPGLPDNIVAQWTDVLARMAKSPAWLAGTEKIGGIARILSPADTRKFVAEQYRVFDGLGKQLGIELK
jgi:tripartite-type tricarboxylate transporter receptor subunit TctC